MKIVSLIFRIVAIVLICISFFTLFASELAVLEEEMWGISTTTGSRVDLDSEYSYKYYNFFERIEKLKDEGHKVGLETFILVTFAACVIVLVLSFIFKFAKGFYFAAVPLLLMILCIAFSGKVDTNYVLDSEFLGIIYGYRVFQDTVINFGNNLVAPAVMSFMVFVFQLLAGIFDSIRFKKEAQEAKLAREAAELEAAALAAQACPAATENTDAPVDVIPEEISAEPVLEVDE